MVFLADPGVMALLGAERVTQPPTEFGSRSEEVLYYELLRRRVDFIYQWKNGDIPFTPEREERSADFLIPDLALSINPTSTFTHTPEGDRVIAWLYRLIGIETIFIDEAEIVPEMGGDPDRALDRFVPQLRQGQGLMVYRRPAEGLGMRRYGQPRRVSAGIPAGQMKWAESGF